VLHHHPDKRRARGLPVKGGEDDYFTCITRGNIVFCSRVKLMKLACLHEYHITSYTHRLIENLSS